MTVMATCSAWRKTRARPHQALHLSQGYKEPKLLLWSSSIEIKRKILPRVWNKRIESK